MGICADSPAGFSAQAGVGVLVGWWRAQRDRVDLSISKLANDEVNGAQRLGLPCEIWRIPEFGDLFTRCQSPSENM